MADVFCNHCGHRNPPGRQLLLVVRRAARARRRATDHDHVRTGRRRRRRPTTRSRSTSTSCPPASGMLVVDAGPERRARGSPLDEDVVTAGRHPDSDIFLDDITVSRRHAEIAATAERLRGRATSARSTAPTSTGSGSRRRRCTDGDELQIGKFKLRLPRRAGGVSAADGRPRPPVHRRGPEPPPGRVPDVTISKIRFLESQGLLDPERTPSGYRKFYDADIERLRWILRQQRENFLPLKVIKDRLEEAPPAAGRRPPDEPAGDRPSGRRRPVAGEGAGRRRSGWPTRPESPPPGRRRSSPPSAPAPAAAAPRPTAPTSGAAARPRLEPARRRADRRSASPGPSWRRPAA